MEEVKKKGRKPLPPEEKKKIASIYLSPNDLARIKAQYGTISQAFKIVILPTLKN